MSPRFLLQYWHFRYNLCFLFCSLCLFIFYAYAALSAESADKVWALACRAGLCAPRGAVCACVSFPPRGRRLPCATHALPCSQSSRSWKLLIGYTVLLFLDIIHRSILLLRMHVFLSRSVRACAQSHADELLPRQIDSSPNADMARERRSSCPSKLCASSTGFRTQHQRTLWWPVGSPTLIFLCEIAPTSSTIWSTNLAKRDGPPACVCSAAALTSVWLYRVGWQACKALHTISLTFMIWICLTIVLILISTSCCCFSHRRYRSEPATFAGNTGNDLNDGNSMMRRALQDTSLPGNQISNFQGQLMALQSSIHRMERVHALPTAHEPPVDGDVCGVCLESEVAGSVWRLLPCGHRFHTSCVDEWLYRPGGACPTCRKDPIAGLDAGVAPMSGLRYDAEANAGLHIALTPTDQDEEAGRPAVFTPTEEVEMRGAVREAWGEARSAEPPSTTIRMALDGSGGWAGDGEQSGESGAQEHGIAAPAPIRERSLPHQVGESEMPELPSPRAQSDDQAGRDVFIPYPGDPRGGFYLPTHLSVVTVSNGPSVGAGEVLSRSTSTSDDDLEDRLERGSRERRSPRVGARD